MEELASNMCSFIFEVRKTNGEEFLPNTLVHLVAGVQRYIRIEGRSALNIFKDREFAEFRVCLDAEMKSFEILDLDQRRRVYSLYQLKKKTPCGRKDY